MFFSAASGLLRPSSGLPHSDKNSFRNGRNELSEHRWSGGLPDIAVVHLLAGLSAARC